jgi:hypothetical protein
MVRSPAKEATINQVIFESCLQKIRDSIGAAEHGRIGQSRVCVKLCGLSQASLVCNLLAVGLRID